MSLPRHVRVAVPSLAMLVVAGVDCSSSPRGTSCPGGAPANGGRCVLPIADNQYDPAAVVTDGANAFWANRGDGAIAWGGIGLIGAPVLIATEQSAPSHLAIDGANLYWATSDGKIVALALPPTAVEVAPASPVVLATQEPLFEGSGSAAIAGLATNGFDVFWALPAGSMTEIEGDVMEVFRGGGPATTVATAAGLPVDLAADATNVYWAAAVPTSPDLLEGVGRIYEAPVGGGAATVLATTDFAVAHVAVDSVNVYFANDDTVTSSPLAGGSEAVLASRLHGVGGLATDGAYVYFTDLEGTLQRVPTGGGPVETLAEQQDGASGLAVGPGGVFLSRSVLGTGSVVEITPK